MFEELQFRNSWKKHFQFMNKRHPYFNHVFTKLRCYMKYYLDKFRIVLLPLHKTLVNFLLIIKRIRKLATLNIPSIQLDVFGYTHKSISEQFPLLALLLKLVMEFNNQGGKLHQ